MSLVLLITAVTCRGDGRSYIGFTETAPGGPGWVRISAPTASGILYPNDYQLPCGNEPRVGDLVRLEASWADRRPYQPENRLTDPVPWQLLERPASRPWFARLESLPVERGRLFGTEGRAVRASGVSVPASIVVVEPEEVSAACVWDEQRERYRARVRFRSGGNAYDLPLIDLPYSRIVRRKGQGIYCLDELGCRAPHGLRLLVTLGAPFQGWCYKMVASLLPRRTVTLMRDGTSSQFPFSVRRPPVGAMEQSHAAVVGA